MPWLSLSLLIGAGVLLVLERVPALRRRRARVLRPGFAIDLIYLGVGFLAGGRLAAAYVEAAGAWLGRLGAPRPALTFALAVPVALLLLDLGNYLAHYLMHRVDALWEIHKVHHSSRRLDWLATFRSHLLEQLLRRVLAPVGLILLGVPAPAVITAAALFTLWATFNHANLGLELRWLEPLFITPRLHLRHHTPAAGATNLGTFLSLWDRLRGSLDTRTLPADVELGVPGEVTSYPQDLIGQQRAPFRRRPRGILDPA